ncbi:MAG: glycosyltransferase family 39 protein [Myxococcota bacterium]|nr:glycosyltransferase family 39 protein [Myxococcota bacterium]
MYASFLVVLIAAAGPKTPAQKATVSLSDGRTVKALVDTAALKRGDDAIQISPLLANGQFWSFGDAFKRTVYYDCGKGLAPTWTAGETNRLACSEGTPRLRPDITWPEDAAAHPNSNIPPVRPGGRPVAQGLHFLLGWGTSCGVALVFFALLSWFSRQQAIKAPKAPSIESPPNLERLDWLWMSGLTLLGLVLRLVHIGDEPFEQNEFTYYMSGYGHDSLLGVLFDVNAMAQTHPPLPHLILWLMEFIGNDEIWARVPQALFGAATLPLVFRLTWNTTRGHRPAAIVATLAAAVSSVHVWYSQDVSPYTLTTFFGALTLFGGQLALGNPDNRRAWWYWVIGGWGLVYTHYYGIHLSFGIVLASFILCARRKAGYRRLFWRTINAGSILWMGIVPWVPAFAQAYLWSRTHSTAYQRTALVYHPTQNLLADLLDLIRLVGGYPSALAGLAVVGLIVGLLHLPFRHQSLRDRLLLAIPLLWFIPFELINRATFLKSLYGGYYFGVRYFLFLFPIAWVLCGWCIQSAQRPSVRRILKLGTYSAAAISIALSSWESVRHLSEREKPDVLSAARLVKAHLQDGDAVLVGPAAFYHHPFHYYFAEPEVRDRLGVNALMRTPAWQPVFGQAATQGPVRPLWLGILSDLFEPYERSLDNRHVQRVWVVDHQQHLLDRPEFSGRPSQTITEVVSEHFKPIYEQAFHDVTVTLYERLTYSAANPERIHFGWSDGAYVRSVEPPWAYVAPGRRLRLGTQVRLPSNTTRPVQSIALRLGLTPAGGHNAKDCAPPEPTTVRIMAGRRMLASKEIRDFTTLRVPIPEGLTTKDLILTLDRDAPSHVARPPEVVLDWMDITYGSVSERSPSQ